MESTPRIINFAGEIFIGINDAEDKQVTLVDYNERLKRELEGLNKIEISTVGSKVNENQVALSNLGNQLNQLSLNYEMLSPELNYDNDKLKQYGKQLEAVQEDLRKNKGALKVKKLGFDLPAETASDICPTCHQEIRDSLLPIEIHQTAMRLEDNIAYIEAQQKMIEVYVDGQKRNIQEKQKNFLNINHKLLTLGSL
ncbi:hypothetical protein ACRQ5D_14630 [Mucilaginibacter sp. P25]|uniref:hypothetical protein n=1 Tax=Mucilaginibacter sp. P25 TaxID=3423945 RepID=UPI003D7B098C